MCAVLLRTVIVYDPSAFGAGHVNAATLAQAAGHDVRDYTNILEKFDMNDCLTKKTPTSVTLIFPRSNDGRSLEAIRKCDAFRTIIQRKTAATTCKVSNHKQLGGIIKKKHTHTKHNI
jgi:hypothetical protein